MVRKTVDTALEMHKKVSAIIAKSQDPGEIVERIGDAFKSFDYPIPSTMSAFNFEHIGNILQQHTTGQFSVSGRLWDEIRSDDRVGNALESRVSMSLDLWKPETVAVQQRDETPESVYVANWWTKNIFNIVNSASLKRISQDQLGLGFALRQIIYGDSAFDDGPNLYRWHPSNCWYNVMERNFRATTMDSGQIRINPMGGKWSIFTTNSDEVNNFYECWDEALVKRLARVWMVKQFALRDWSRYSEVYGNLIKKLLMPATASKQDKQSQMQYLKTMSTGGVFPCLTDSKGTKLWDIELLAPPTGTSDVMRMLIGYCNSAIDTAILGQSSTTDLKSGGANYKAVEVLYSGVALGKARSDISAFNEAMRPFVKSVTRVVFGRADLAPVVSINGDKIQYSPEQHMKLGPSAASDTADNEMETQDNGNNTAE
jgi:hypothetical protein